MVLNFISARAALRLGGCSDEFYETIVRPFHGLQV